MARIIGDKKLNARLSQAAQGMNVTPILLKGAERTRQEYVEEVNRQSAGRPDVRYSPRRAVTVSAPGSAPNSDTGDLVNSTGVTSERKNQAETFASAAHAEALEYGTHKMAPRPAMQPAFENTKAHVLKDLAQAMRDRFRG